MTTLLAPLRAIPCNVITGFLGVGKTTVIRHLLQNKPVSERWAVLVNEFGDVGLDGVFLQQAAGGDGGIAIKEVAGGCMCCAVGVPTRVALTQLIRRERPDRVLIEPSGLAHPDAIIRQIEHDFAGVLQLRAVITLVDAACFDDPRLMALPLFQDQVTAADLLVATKADTTSSGALAAFTRYCAENGYANDACCQIGAGELPLAWLDRPHRRVERRARDASHRVVQGLGGAQTTEAVAIDWDNDGIARYPGTGADAFSYGWMFDRRWQWQHAAVSAWMAALPVPRIKAVLLTDEGWWLFNRMRDQVSAEPWQAETEPTENRLEMIAMQAQDWAQLECQLRALRGR